MNNIEEGYYDDAYEWMNVEVNNIQIFKSSLAFLSLFFTLSFSLRNYFKYYQLDSLTCNQLVSRIVSSVHAVTVTSMAVWLLLTDNRIGNFVVIYHNFYVSLTLNIVIGNMIADIIIMSIYKELFDKTFILHHLLAIIAFYPCSGVGFFPAMALYRLFSEGSTLFINMRWILLTFDMKDSNMYTINAILVLITFTICRVIPIVPMWFICLQYPFVLPIWPSINFGYKALFTVICIILDTLNVHWYFKIIQLIWKFFFLPSNGGASSTGTSSTNGLLSASSSSASLASSIASSGSGAPKKDTCND